MSYELTSKAKMAFQNMVDLEDDEKVLLEDGSLRDLLEKEKVHRQTFEYVKSVTDKLRAKDKETQKRYFSNKIKFRNMSTLSGAAAGFSEIEELDKPDQLLYQQRKLMGQSVEWGKLPFEFDSIGSEAVPANKLGKKTIHSPHKNADTSYRRNAQLYSSIMGKSTRNSIRPSTTDTAATHGRAAAANVKMSLESAQGINRIAPNLEVAAAASSGLQGSFDASCQPD